MSSNTGWLGMAVVVLVGCGGEVADPRPLPIEEIDVVDQGDRDDHRDSLDQEDTGRRGSRGLLDDVTGHEHTGRGVKAPPPPTTDDPPSPPKEPPPPPPTMSCLTIVAGPGDVHLATLSFGRYLSRADSDVALDLDFDAASSITSLGRQGDALFACSLGKVIRITMDDGAVEKSSLSCDAVAADGDGIWVQSSARAALERYDSWKAVTARKPRKQTFAPLEASRIGVHGGVVIGAIDGPMATTQLVRVDTASGERTEAPSMGIRGPINRGVDLASDGKVYLTYGSTMFARYDPATRGMSAAGVLSSSADGFRGIVCE